MVGIMESKTPSMPSAQQHLCFFTHFFVWFAGSGPDRSIQTEEGTKCFPTQKRPLGIPPYLQDPIYTPVVQLHCWRGLIGLGPYHIQLSNIGESSMQPEGKGTFVLIICEGLCDCFPS